MVESVEVTARAFWWLVLVFVATAAGFAILLLSSEKTYESRTLLLFKLGREYIYIPETEEAGARAPDPGGFEFAVNAETQILNSRTLKEQVVKRIGAEVLFPDLAGDPQAQTKAVEALEQAVSISLITGSHVVQVAVSHRDPEMAARLANELVAIFLVQREGIFRTVDPVLLQARMDEVRAKMTVLETELEGLIDGGDVLSFEASEETLVIENRRIREELLETRLQIAALGEQENLVAADLNQLEPVVVDQRDDGPNPTVSAAEASILTLRARARALVSQFGQSHPSVVALDREIAELESLAKSQPAEVRLVTRSAVNPLYTRAQTVGFDLKLARAEHNARREYLEDRLAENIRAIAETAQRTGSVDLILDRLAIQREHYSELYSQFERAESAELSSDGPNNIRIIEAAAPPLVAAGAPNSVKAGLAVLLAAIATLAVLVLRIMTSGTVVSAAGITSRLGLPVLGEIERRNLPQEA